MFYDLCDSVDGKELAETASCCNPRPNDSVVELKLGHSAPPTRTEADSLSILVLERRREA